MTPPQCAKRCDDLIKRLQPEFPDRYRIYAKRQIERVLDPPRDESEFLAELEALLRESGGKLRREP